MGVIKGDARIRLKFLDLSVFIITERSGEARERFHMNTSGMKCNTYNLCHIKSHCYSNLLELNRFLIIILCLFYYFLLLYFLFIFLLSHFIFFYIATVANLAFSILFSGKRV